MEANNVKAMREALEDMMKFTCNCCQERYCEEDVEEEDGQRIPSPCSVIIKARDALNLGRRNCDRFANEADARKAFIVWYNTVYELNGDKWNEVSICDLKHNVNDILQDYIEWLFSPAEDTKGESDE